jgi:hypothetical protein
MRWGPVGVVDGERLRQKELHLRDEPRAQAGLAPVRPLSLTQAFGSNLLNAIQAHSTFGD